MSVEDNKQMDVTPKPLSVPVSRRALLRGATGALPVVLTLQSGAALAKSSNLIGTVNNASKAIGPNGRIQCLDAASAVDGTPAQLDLGNDPMLHVQYISNRQYYKPNSQNNAGNTNKPVSIKDMCENGGVYWYKDNTGWGGGTWRSTAGGYNNRGIENGFMVSATALASFSADIKQKTTF